MLQARMNHPVMVVPEAMKALQSLGDLTKEGLPEKLLELVHLRASQINGCSACVAYFTDSERAALALTEALTRISDRAEPISDAVWGAADKHFDEQELAALILAIANINVWNRLNVAVRQPAGVWKG